jgi:hypothetical protein
MAHNRLTGYVLSFLSIWRGFLLPFRTSDAWTAFARFPSLSSHIKLTIQVRKWFWNTLGVIKGGQNSSARKANEGDRGNVAAGK